MNEKDNEMLDIASEIENEERQSTVPQYHVYDYFKQHSSAFFATVSAFIATISLALNFAAFLSTNSYLMYFRVDNVTYKSSTQFLYFIAIALVFSAIIILFQGFLSKTFDSYLPYRRKHLLYKYCFKIIKKDIKYGNKKRKAIRNNFILTSNISTDNDNKLQPEKDLEWLNKSSQWIENEYKSIKKMS